MCCGGSGGKSCVKKRTSRHLMRYCLATFSRKAITAKLPMQLCKHGRTIYTCVNMHFCVEGRINMYCCTHSLVLLQVHADAR